VKLSYNDPLRYQTEFPFSYSEAKNYGFAIATHHRCISELMEKGFIDPADKGGLRGLGRSCSSFTLSWRWKDYGNPDFEKIIWSCFQPKDRSRAKAKMKTYKGNNGNETPIADVNLSKNDVVGANLT